MPRRKKPCTTCGHGATDQTLHQRPKPVVTKDPKVVAALAQAALANLKRKR